MKSAFLKNNTYNQITLSWYMSDRPEYRDDPCFKAPPGNIFHLWSACYPWPPNNPDINIYEYEQSIKALAPEKPDKYMFFTTVGCSILPMRKISAQAKARLRRRRMEDRIRKKDPLFADQFIENELLKGKYDPFEIINEDIEHEKRIEEFERQEFNFFIENSVLNE